MRSNWKKRIALAMFGAWFVFSGFLVLWIENLKHIVVIKDGYVSIAGGCLSTLIPFVIFLGMYLIGTAFEKDIKCKACGKSVFSPDAYMWAADEYCELCFDKYHGDQHEALYGKRLPH